MVVVVVVVVVAVVEVGGGGVGVVFVVVVFGVVVVVVVVAVVVPPPKPWFGTGTVLPPPVGFDGGTPRPGTGWFPLSGGDVVAGGAPTNAKLLIRPLPAFA